MRRRYTNENSWNIATAAAVVNDIYIINYEPKVVTSVALVHRHGPAEEEGLCLCFSRRRARSRPLRDHVYLADFVLPGLNRRGRERWLWQRGNLWIRSESPVELLLHHLSVSRHTVRIDPTRYENKSSIATVKKVLFKELLRNHILTAYICLFFSWFVSCVIPHNSDCNYNNILILQDTKLPLSLYIILTSYKPLLSIYCVCAGKTRGILKKKKN